MAVAPFHRSPDSFWLRLMSRPARFEVLPYETVFGDSDEMLCYFEGTLIGIAPDQGNPDELVVDLLPRLDRSRDYPWPTAEAFERAVSAMLNQTVKWQLSVERDTDQMPVPSLRNRASLKEELSKVVQYCTGANPACPTFEARDEELAA